MFGKTKKNTEAVLVFDIGSASVGGAIVLFSKERKPKILYSTRKQMVLQEDLDAKKFTTAMIRTLNLVASTVEKKGLTHLNFLKIENKEITKSFCFLSSPWYESQTKVVKIKKEKPFLVTEELMNSIISKEENNFMKAIQEKNENKDEVELIDKKIIQVKLNGYRIENPYKKKTKNFEAYIFMSFVSKNVLNKVKKIVNKHFHLEELNINSFILPTFLSLRDIFNYEEDFVFIDLNGEVTDVSFIKDGVLRETKTFPIGRNTFIKEVMKSFKLNYESAFSLSKTYINGEVDEKTSLKFEKTLTKSKNNWLRFFENSILDLSKGAVLPRSLFMMVSPDLGKFIKESIKKEIFTKLIFPDYNETVSPVLIDSHKISDFCDFGNKKERDIFIGMESVFINRFVDPS